MTTSRRSIGLALVFGLLAGALAGGGAVLARGPLAVTAPLAPAAATGTTNLVGQTPTAGADVAAGPATGTASSGAIAYPYPGYPGSAGLAPDHTIVVTGVGQASLAADGSGRAAAATAAITAALADAKAQADLIASTLGVSITGVLSVSSSVSDYGQIYAVPMLGGSSAPGAPVPAPTDGVSLPQLSVAVTVAYSIG